MKDPIAIRIIKWPLRPFVRFFFKIRQWIVSRRDRFIYQLLWKPRGYTWIEYYATRLDKDSDASIKNNRHLSKEFKKYVSEVEGQAILLKKYGLQPEHKFLDYGCGQLRLANYLLEYLNPNKYVGVEISKKRIEIGKLFLAAHGHNDKQFETFVVSDCYLKALDGLKFDFAWSYSVFTHMPKEDIMQMLQSLKSLLAKGGQYLFSFSHMEKTKVIGKDYYYSFDDMKAICEEVGGYDYEVLEPAWPVDFSAIAKVQLRHSAT